MTTDQVRPAEAEPTDAYPPRFRWLRLLTLVSIVLALVCVFVRVAWGREARRRLGEALAPMVARGEPVSGPGIFSKSVPDAENGALLYRRAIAAIGSDSPAASAMDYPAFPPFPRRWHRMEDESVRTNVQTFRLMREARGRERFDWAFPATTPAIGAAIPHLNKARHLANLTGDAALHAHAHGDDFEALERVRDLRHFSAAIDAPPYFLITHLVSVGIDDVALNRLETIAPRLTIAGDGTPPPHPEADPVTPRPATRAQVQALIAELLDPGNDKSLRRAYVTERATQLDLVDWVGAKARLLRPMFQLDAVRIARADEAIIRASEQSNSQAVKQILAAEPLLQRKPQSPALSGPAAKGAASAPLKDIDYTQILGTDIGTLSTPRAIEQDLRLRTERRFAAVILAARLYRADHGGAFPPSAEALVPKYLPSIPADPGAADGRPLKYILVRGALPGGGDRPVVYSVGADGRDNTVEWGLARAGLPAEPQYQFTPGPDQWRDLTLWQPPQSPQDLALEAQWEAPTGPAK